MRECAEVRPFAGVVPHDAGSTDVSPTVFFSACYMWLRRHFGLCSPQHQHCTDTVVTPHCREMLENFRANGVTFRKPAAGATARREAKAAPKGGRMSPPRTSFPFLVNNFIRLHPSPSPQPPPPTHTHCMRGVGLNGFLLLQQRQLHQNKSRQQLQHRHPQQHQLQRL